MDQLGGVVADAILEDDFDLLDVFDLLRRIAAKDDDIGSFSGRNRPNRCVFAQEYCAVQRSNADRLDRGESGFDEMCIRDREVES